MAYGPDLADAYKRVGWYVIRVLGGAALGCLPIEQRSVFGLVINEEERRRARSRPCPPACLPGPTR